MKKAEYKKIVKRHTPKEERLKNSIIAFIVGGFLGVIGHFLLELYSAAFNVSSASASVLMIVTLIFLGCLLTGLGFFDEWVHFSKAGLFIPITGFAHAMMSATLEYKKEGMVTGIGANMFKLAGSVIIFGVVSAFTFCLIRVTLGCFI